MKEDYPQEEDPPLCNKQGIVCNFIRDQSNNRSYTGVSGLRMVKEFVTGCSGVSHSSVHSFKSTWDCTLLSPYVANGDIDG